MAFTPVAGDIQVTPGSTMGNANYDYLDTYRATRFTVHTNVAP